MASGKENNPFASFSFQPISFKSAPSQPFDLLEFSDVSTAPTPPAPAVQPPNELDVLFGSNLAKKEEKTNAVKAPDFFSTAFKSEIKINSSNISQIPPKNNVSNQMFAKVKKSGVSPMNDWGDFNKWNTSTSNNNLNNDSNNNVGFEFWGSNKSIEEKNSNLSAKIEPKNNTITLKLQSKDEKVINFSYDSKEKEEVTLKRLMALFPGIKLDFYFESNNKLTPFSELANLDPSLTYTLIVKDENVNKMYTFEEKQTKPKEDYDVKTHHEFKKALEILKEGMHVLKISSKGKPNFRFFQCDPLELKLFWYSANKMKDESEIKFAEMVNFVLGQKTRAFTKGNLAKMSHFSLSIRYKMSNGFEKSLDLICRNEFEYDSLLCALKGLINLSKGWKINKNVLLTHSATFNKLMSEAGHYDSDQLFSEIRKAAQTKLHVEDFILLREVTEKNIMGSILNIEEKHRKLLNLYPNGLIVKSIFNDVKDEKQKNIEYFTLQRVYQRFCKNILAVQNELDETFHFFDGETNAYYKNLNYQDKTPSKLIEYFAAKRPKNFKKEAELQSYFQVLNKEIWEIDLDIEAIREIIKRYLDINWKRNKIEKIGDLIGDSIQDSFDDIGKAFGKFGKSIGKALNGWKADFTFEGDLYEKRKYF